MEDNRRTLDYDNLEHKKVAFLIFPKVLYVISMKGYLPNDNDGELSISVTTDIWSHEAGADSYIR